MSDNKSYLLDGPSGSTALGRNPWKVRVNHSLIHVIHFLKIERSFKVKLRDFKRTKKLHKHKMQMKFVGCSATRVVIGREFVPSNDVSPAYTERLKLRHTPLSHRFHLTRENIQEPSAAKFFQCEMTSELSNGMERSAGDSRVC